MRKGERSVLASFMKQAESCGDAVAIVDASRTLTYSELDISSEALASAIRQRELPPNAVVAVDADRTASVVIAILGAWKAGVAYLPIDLSYPLPWIERILGDARARLVISDRIDLHRTISTETLRAVQPEGTTDGAGLDPDPRSAAYVVYTSGSTGLPKGVVVEHGHLAAYVRGVVERLSIDRPLKFALLQPLSFDLPLTTVFPALATGGSIHVVSEAAASNGEALASFTAEHRIDVLKVTPSHLRALRASASRPDDLLPAYALVLGGEASNLEWTRSFVTQEHGCAVFNHYGPTETTVGVAMQEIAPGTATGPSGTTPIGVALSEAALHVLDARLAPVEPGSAGELFIAGESVARGYLGRPGATAERFLPNPYGAGRLYRSGDIVRQLPGGNLEFAGRLDDQVKIRGYRVEPSQVEAVIRAVPSVDDAAIVVVRDDRGEAALVAFVVDHEKADDSEGLREALLQQLPGYLVPRSIISIEALPLTANGKVDKKALLERAQDERDGQIGPPAGFTMSPLEAEIAGVWAEAMTLDVSAISPTSNFFEVGGDSLFAMIVVWRVRNAVGVESLSIADLIDHPTLSGFASHVSEMLADTLGQGGELILEAIGAMESQRSGGATRADAADVGEGASPV